MTDRERIVHLATVLRLAIDDLYMLELRENVLRDATRRTLGFQSALRELLLLAARPAPSVSVDANGAGPDDAPLHFYPWQIEAMRKLSPELAQAVEDVQRENDVTQVATDTGHIVSVVRSVYRAQGGL